MERATTDTGTADRNTMRFRSSKPPSGYGFSSILTKYLLVELFPPLATGLLLMSFALLIISLFKVVDELFLTGAGLFLVLKVLLSLFPTLLTMALPIGCLLSSMLVYGRLSEDRELTAMKAAGMSLFSVTMPAYLLGLLLTLFNFYWTDRITPKSLDILRSTTRQILEQMTSINYFKPGTFNTPQRDIAIYFVEMERGSNTLKNVTIFKSSAESSLNWFGEGTGGETSQASNWTVTAPTATIDPDPARGILRLILHDCVSENLQPQRLSRVFIQEATVTVNMAGRISKLAGGTLTRRVESAGHWLRLAAESRRRYEDLLGFMGIPKDQRHDKVLALVHELIQKETEEPGYLEKNRKHITLVELQEIPQRIQSVQTSINRAMQRYSYPLGTFLFMMVGCSLGILTGQGKRSVCLILTVGVVVCYYIMEKMAEAVSETFAMTWTFDPGLIMWAPNLMLLLLGVILVWINSRH